MSLTVSWSAASDDTPCLIQDGDLSWTSDIGRESGGSGDFPDPHQLLDSALGACTALTLQLYAKRKAIPLEAIQITITHQEEPGLYQLRRGIHLAGNLTEEQRADLLRIANKCPIHKVLSGQIALTTELA